MKPSIVCVTIALPLLGAAAAGRLASAGSSSAGEASKTGPQKDAPAKADAFEFDSAYIVFLRRPANAKSADAATLDQVQKGHLAHLGELYKSGKILAAGPFDEQDDAGFRGLAIYPATLGKDEVRKLAENDPAVKAGRLKVDIVRWYFQKGAAAFPHPDWSVPQ